jgi:hypothetical protein
MKAADRGVPVAGRIGYDGVVTKAQVAGQSIAEYGDGPVREAVAALWESVQHELGKTTSSEEN